MKVATSQRREAVPMSTISLTGATSEHIIYMLAIKTFTMLKYQTCGNDLSTKKAQPYLCDKKLPLQHVKIFLGYIFRCSALQVLFCAEQRQLSGRGRLHQLCLRHLLHRWPQSISPYGDHLGVLSHEKVSCLSHTKTVLLILPELGLCCW